MRKLLCCIIFASLPISAFAQNLSGETEIGTDGKGQPFFSQFAFYDFENSNFLARYFGVRGVVNRGEFGYGPTFNFDETVVKFQFGGTTDRDVMLAGNVSAEIWGIPIFYIADGKLSTTDRPNTLYQKMWTQINKSGSWQLRIEDLQVGNRQGFLRIGVEYRHIAPDIAHLFFAPFYDPINRGFGVQIGFRFF